MEFRRVAFGLAGAILALACVAPAQDRSNWLQAGAAWKYAVAHKDPQLPKEVTVGEQTVVAESAARLPAGMWLHQLRVTRPEQAAVTFEVWSDGTQGVLQHVTKSTQRRGGLQPEHQPMQIWRRPKSKAVGATRRWEWRGPLLGVDVGSGDKAGSSAPGQWLHRAEAFGQESVQVPAGTFVTERIRIRSELAGREPRLRTVWLSPKVGVVQEVRRCGASQRTQRLKQYTPGGEAATDRLVRHVEGLLQRGSVEAYNNTPRVTWLEAGPEALTVAGRIAAVHTDGWSRNYFVGPERIAPFEVTSPGGLTRVAYVAFDSKTAVPKPQTDLHALALLLARAEAGLHQFGNVHEVPVTLAWNEDLLDADQQASAQITGGALDGAQRNIAVRLRFGRRWQHEAVTDTPSPEAGQGKQQEGGGR